MAVMKNLVGAALLSICVAATLPAQAQIVSNQEASVLSTRLYDLSNQVNTGVSSNQLTDAEAAQIRAELSRIEQMRNIANAGGYTLQEVQALSTALENANQMLLSLVSNGVNRPLPIVPTYVPPVYGASPVYGAPWSASIQDRLNIAIQSGYVNPGRTADIQARLNQLNNIEATLNSAAYISGGERRRLNRQARDLRNQLSNDLRFLERSSAGWGRWYY